MFCTDAYLPLSLTLTLFAFTQRQSPDDGAAQANSCNASKINKCNIVEIKSQTKLSDFCTYKLCPLSVEFLF